MIHNEKCDMEKMATPKIMNYHEEHYFFSLKIVNKHNYQ